MGQVFAKFCLWPIVAILACGQANAGLLSIGSANVQFANPIFQQTGSDTVKIFYPKADNSPGSMRVRAGRFTGAATSSDFDPEIIYQDADRAYLYCVDLYQRVWSGANVTYDTYRLTDDSPNTLVSSQHPERNFDRLLDFLGALNFTLATEYAAMGFAQSNYNWLNPTESWMSGAIQLGIWESLYERDQNSSGDIFGGDFRVAGRGDGSSLIDEDGAVLLERTFENLAQNNSQSLGTQYALVLTSDTHQDMIVGDPPVQVPEPGTLALLISGVLLLGARRWQKPNQ